MDLIFETANEYKSIQEAINAQLPCSIQVSIVRPVADRFKVFDDGTVQGAGLKVDVIKKGPDYFCITVSWSTPSTREDGSILNPDEIAGYELQVNDDIYPIAPEVTNYRLEGLTRGLKVLKIRTLSTDNMKSEWSDSISVTLE